MTFDAIIIGGGPAGTCAAELLQKSGFKTAMVVSGHSIHDVSYECYEKSGGRLLMGDTVTGGTISGDRVTEIRTVNLDDFTLHAEWFIIATGKYLGKGLVADMHGISEPIFNLDTAYDKDRDRWFARDFKEDQPFLRFGVITDTKGHPSKEGMTIRNLFACGEILNGISGTDPDVQEQIRNSATAAAETIKAERDARA